MNTYLKFAGVVAVVAVIALVGVAVVAAQGPAPNDGIGPWHGGGFAGRGPGMGGGFMAVDEEAMHTAIAEALGISEAEFEAALAEGKTPYVLADELGVDFAEVQAAMQATHADALAQAVADGALTQEQADWMLSRQAQRGAGFAGPMGRFGGNNGDCPYTPPAE